MNVTPPSPGLRLISAVVAAINVAAFFAFPDGPRYLWAGIATFHILCCLTPAERP